MTELKSLKNPTRIITALAFISFIIYSIGMDGLHQIFPSAPEVLLTIVFGAATWAVTQYGTEKRVVRAEELRDEFNSNSNDQENQEDMDNLSDALEEGA